MEGQEITKKVRAKTALKIKLAIALTLFALLFSKPVLAFSWLSVVGIILTVVAGLMYMLIAYLYLLVAIAVSAFLIPVLVCSLVMNPHFYGRGGFISNYASSCGLSTDPNKLPISGISNMIGMFMKILYPMFAVALVVLAGYFIFMAPSPQHRARAKQMLTKIMIAMVLSALAPPLYQLLIAVSGSMTDGVLSAIETNILSGYSGGISLKITQAITLAVIPAAAAGAGSQGVTQALIDSIDPIVITTTAVALWIMVIFLLMAILVSMFRYTTVIFLGILFPLTLAMYMFEFTRNPGRKLLKATIVFIFTPTIMAMWLAIGVAILPAVASGDRITGMFLLMIMTLMISWSPLQVSGFMSVVGAILVSIGQFIPSGWGTLLVAAGGVMQGKGATALAGAALKYSGGKLLSAGKGAMGKALQSFKAARSTGGNLLGALGKGAAAGGRSLGASARGLASGTVDALKGAKGKIGGALTSPGKTLKGVGLKAALGKGGAKAFGKMTGKGVSAGAAFKKIAGIRAKRLGQFALRATVGLALQKATGGLISGRDIGKLKLGAGSTLKAGRGAWTALKGMGLKGALKGAAKLGVMGAGLALAGAALGPLGIGAAVAVAGIGLMSKGGRQAIGNAVTKSWRGAGRSLLGSVGGGGGLAKRLGAIAGGTLGVTGLAALGIALGPLGVAIAAGVGLGAYGLKKGIQGGGIGRGLGSAWTRIQTAGRGLKAGLGNTWQGIRTNGIGKSLKGSTALTAFGSSGVGLAVGGLMMLTPLGLAAAAGIGLGAAAGTAMFNKKIRDGTGRLIAVGAWNQAKKVPEKLKEQKEAAKKAIKGIKDIALKAVLGAEYEGYVQKAGTAKGRLGRVGALAGALSLRAFEKAFGFSEEELKTINGRIKGDKALKESEEQRKRITKALETGDVSKLSDSDKKELAKLLGMKTKGKNWKDNLRDFVNDFKNTGDISKLSTRGRQKLAKLLEVDTKAAGWQAALTTKLGGMSSDERAGRLVQTSNNHFDSKAEGIKKTYNLDNDMIYDKSKAKKSLTEDAQTDNATIDAARARAQSSTGKERTAGIKKAEELEDKNPVRLTANEAEILGTEGQVKTRGELANLTPESSTAIAESRKRVAKAVGSGNISQLNRKEKEMLARERGIKVHQNPNWEAQLQTDLGTLTNKQKSDLIKKTTITDHRLKGMQASAKKGCERKVTRSEQCKLDAGATKDQLEDIKTRDRTLKDTLGGGGGQRPMQEDFLTSIEEERGQQG